MTYLARETQARRIHVLGYSAGTRVVIETLGQLSLIHQGDDAATIREQLRLGHVILTGSDVDPALLGGYIVDGLLDLQDRLAIYVSEVDKALGFAGWLYERPRLGQLADDDALGQTAIVSAKVG